MGSARETQLQVWALHLRPATLRPEAWLVSPGKQRRPPRRRLWHAPPRLGWRDESSPSRVSPAGSAPRRTAKEASAIRWAAAVARASGSAQRGARSPSTPPPASLPTARAPTSRPHRFGRRGKARTPGSGTDASGLPGVAPGEVGGCAAVVEEQWERKRPRATQVPHGAAFSSLHASSSRLVACCFQTAALDERCQSPVAEVKRSPSRLAAE